MHLRDHVPTHHTTNGDRERKQEKQRMVGKWERQIYACIWYLYSTFLEYPKVEMMGKSTLNWIELSWRDGGIKSDKLKQSKKEWGRKVWGTYRNIWRMVAISCTILNIGEGGICFKGVFSFIQQGNLIKHKSVFSVICCWKD